MKTMGYCVLSVLLAMAVHGGISDALSASGPALPRTPVPPSSAATPPSRDIPAEGTVPDAPAGISEFAPDGNEPRAADPGAAANRDAALRSRRRAPVTNEARVKARCPECGVIVIDGASASNR